MVYYNSSYNSITVSSNSFDHNSEVKTFFKDFIDPESTKSGLDKYFEIVIIN